MPLQQSIRPIVSIVLIVLSVLGLNNVYGDNTEVEDMAREVACPGCESTLRSIQRTPLSQEFHLMTEKNGMIVVECARSGIFVGSYSCKEAP